VLAGYGGGGVVFGSLVATASDRLNDHGLILSSAVYGSLELFDVDLTYVNQEHRLIWGLSVFHDVAPLFDDTFKTNDAKSVRFVSWRRFFGGGAITRYPFTQFLYAQAELGVGAGGYFVTDATAKELADPMQNNAERNLLAPWQANNQGLRFHTEGGLSLGYSTIGYHRATGPIRGTSLLLSHSVGTEPFDSMTYQQSRLDLEHYIRIIGAMNLLLRGATGSTLGSQRAPQFFLSSFHTLRGVPFGSTDFLLGREFFYSTIELQFPIATFLEFPLIDLEGVLAADFGGVGDGPRGVWDRRVLDLVFGFNLGFAPIVLRIHFGQPIGIGAPVPNHGNLTVNFSIVYRYQ
jgi:outer membrane protein assembly factor BamA